MRGRSGGRSRGRVAEHPLTGEVDLLELMVWNCWKLSCVLDSTSQVDKQHRCKLTGLRSLKKLVKSRWFPALASAQEKRARWQQQAADRAARSGGEVAREQVKAQAQRMQARAKWSLGSLGVVPRV